MYLDLIVAKNNYSALFSPFVLPAAALTLSSVYLLYLHDFILFDCQRNAKTKRRIAPPSNFFLGDRIKLSKLNLNLVEGAMVL